MTHLPAAEQALDRALERIHLTSATWRGNLANHAPMAVDALVELSRADAIPSFFEAYGPNLEPDAPKPPRRLDDWTVHLGERAAAPRLTAHFEALLVDAPIARVLNDVLPVLMYGVLGGSLHGLIRLGHAMAAFERHDTPFRRREVAHALGYWASEHLALEGSIGAEPRIGAADALAALSPMPDSLRVEGIITDRAAAAANSPVFHREIAAIDLGGPVEATLDALLRAAATWLVEEPASQFTYLHAITGTSALRGLLSYFTDDAARREGLGHYVHALAAIRAMSRRPPIGRSVQPAPLLQLIEVAVASCDDHKIKLAAAVSRENVRLGDGRLLAAASAFITSAGA